MIFIDYAKSDKCLNPECYETCLQCNKCGRFDVKEKNEEKEQTK
jgi:hypothetical protein